MEWKILKEQYREVINNQLTTDPEETTIMVHEQLLKNGYEHEQIVDKLIPYLHDQIIDQSSQEEEQIEWKDRILPLMEDSILEAEYINKAKAEKIIKSTRKEFGIIPAGGEGPYEEGLRSFEYNLYLMSNLFGLNSRQLKEIAKIWIVGLYECYQDDNYDLSSTFDNDFIEMAKQLINSCNIYTNPELMEQFKQMHPEMDPVDPETKLSTYTMNFRCLNKILDSMDFWIKKYGSNGYLQFISKSFK